MLKIKDTVDLKELEKFGFCKINESYMIPYGYELNVENNDETNNWSTDGIGMIEVDELDVDGKKDRTLHLVTTTNDEVWWDIDILFDLIQAGLVIKENENERN